MFDSALAASLPRREGHPGARLLPLAVLAHALVLGGAMVGGSWKVGALPPPEALGVVFLRGAPPPPLGGGRPERAATPAAPPEKERARPVLRQPVEEGAEVPPLAPAPETAEVLPQTGDPSDAGPQVGPGGPGVPWGVEKSLGPVGALPGPGDAGEDIVYPVGGGITPPQLLERVLPRYTETARQARRQGHVLLQATIDTSGRVVQTRVLQGLGFGLDEAAVAAVERWRYRPAELGGRRVSVYLNLTVNFRLQ